MADAAERAGDGVQVKADGAGDGAEAEVAFDRKEDRGPVVTAYQSPLLAVGTIQIHARVTGGDVARGHEVGADAKGASADEDGFAHTSVRLAP